MRKYCFLLLGLLLLCSHDLYLKMESYFIAPNSQAVISLFNGTFDKSENLIDRDRMEDASILAHGKKRSINPDSWIDRDTTITQLQLETQASGTYVVGVSTKARTIELAATKFNDYLEHDGVLDMLAMRKKNKTDDQDAVEQYSKHVKAIVQVGDQRTEDWNTVLGYPLEFVPQSNPYNSYTGDEITIQLLKEGQPLANQLVYAHHRTQSAGHSHNNDTTSQTHDNGETHSHDAKTSSHTHDNGVTHSHDANTSSHTHDNGETHSHDANTTSHTHDNGETHSHDDDTTNHTHENGETHSHDANATSHTHDNGETHSHDDDTTNHRHENGETHSHNDDNLKSTTVMAADSHNHSEGQQLRTDKNGMITVQLPNDGLYYLRTIHMVTSDQENLTHVSNWATLSFEVTHQHDASTHTHDNHEEEGLPSWIFWAGSLLIVGLLFLVFRKKTS